MTRYLTIFALFLAGCVSKQTPHVGGCVHSHQLPPLRLEKDQKLLLASVSAKPHTALDYYMLLPDRYFSFLPPDPERRISYIDHASLTSDYISASHWFECDGGGFEVTIRVFRRPNGDLIAIDSSEELAVSLFSRDERQSGLNSVTLKKPIFWKYDTGWKRLDDAILPSMTLQSILDQYTNKYMADQKYPGQPKFIYLDYRLLPSGDTIPVIGRENFMDSAPTWAEYSLTGTMFKKK